MVTNVRNGRHPVHGRNDAYAPQTFLSPSSRLPHAPWERKTPESAVLVSSKKPRLTDEMRQDVACQMLQWKEDGSPKDGTIASIADEFGITDKHVLKIYRNLKTNGTVASIKPPGRPTLYGSDVTDLIIKVVDEARAKQQVASAAMIQKRLSQAHINPLPSEVTINKIKHNLGFEKKKVLKKPLVSSEMQETRLRDARKLLRMYKLDGGYNIVVVDEKNFGQEDDRKYYECRKEDEVPRSVAFIGVQAETRTQRPKVMYFTAVSRNEKIVIIKLDWSKNLTIKGKKAKGMDSKGMKRLWKRVHDAAKEKLPHGSIPFLLLDRSPVHTSKATQDELNRVWGVGNWMFQPPKSPDMNNNDAGVYPFMSREVAKAGAISKTQVEAAVMKVWRTKLNDAILENISLRVQRNLETVIRLNGGNLYDESAL